MIIANPIFDVVFKRLMENERVAKFFIGTLLGATVEELTIRPQEFTYVKDPVVLAVFRLDFAAVIALENGERQRVLIEIQKAGEEVDLMRFRKYLAEQYKKQDKINGKKEILPIKTIYVLGFKLPTIESACVHIERQHRDMITDQVIEKKSRFVESLTHDSYVVQAERVTGKYQTRLEQLLSVFEQAHFIDERGILKDYPHDTRKEDELKLMVDILHHSGTDPETRKELEIEQEAWRSINAMFETREQELREEIQKREAKLSEKEEQLERERQEKEKVLRELEELRKKLKGN